MFRIEFWAMREQEGMVSVASIFNRRVRLHLTRLAFAWVVILYHITIVDVFATQPASQSPYPRCRRRRRRCSRQSTRNQEPTKSQFEMSFVFGTDGNRI